MNLKISKNSLHLSMSSKNVNGFLANIFFFTKKECPTLKNRAINWEKRIIANSYDFEQINFICIQLLSVCRVVKLIKKIFIRLKVIKKKKKLYIGGVVYYY